MLLKGSYTVPPGIGLEETTYPSACVLLKEGTFWMDDITASAVFTIYSDETTETKLFDFVTSIDFAPALVFEGGVPSSTQQASAMTTLISTSIGTMCPEMEAV